jgi:hypothetical protein
MTYEQETANVPELSHISLALGQYAEALASTQLRKKGKRWLPGDRNFVTFQIQSARKKDIVMTLRGDPPEFEVDRDLPLLKDRKGYSRGHINSPKQLKAAATYVQRAHELFSRGSNRTPLTLER